MKPARPPRIAILYHFFPPDDVVSAQEFGGLAAGLAARGWDVEVLASNRFCHGIGKLPAGASDWKGVRLHRLWRPGFSQDRGKGRILNALWMIASWCRLAFRRGAQSPDIVLTGTDPIFSLLVAGVLKRLRPRTRQAHWAFDLYPEAAVADELFIANSGLVKLTRRLMNWAYQSCDLIVDIGPCMQERIRAYGPTCPQVTLVPWALVEPAQVPRADPELRQRLFGDAKLALLYSGSFGRPHEFVEFLELARRLRDSGVVLGFAVRGRRLEELKAALSPDDRNIRLLPFAPEAELEQHLAAADVHLASLRLNWTGIVVPSKFFGSLAIGRPVLYAGEVTADIAQWIKAENVGWVLTRESLDETAAQFRKLTDQPSQLLALQDRCHATYQRRFRKEIILEHFDQELRLLLKRK